jgi:D-alanyl-D-alanine carboxypeptidase/D-alanyl-D-alanine-endopeptidase (penicillin-binding protein 4)
MPAYRFRIFTLILATLAISLPTDSAGAQTKKKTTTSSAKKTEPKKKTTAKKTTKKRTAKKKPATPKPPAYTAPRGIAALQADMAVMASKIRSGKFGIMAMSVTRGDTLFAHNAGVAMVPASTMKLLTSALAYERLGPNYRFSTDALRDGTLSPDGTLNGNIIIRGDGDPSLSGRFLGGGPDAPMSVLASYIARSGVKRITGDVIGDASAFDSERIPQGWLSRYLQSGYAARVSGLSLNENLVQVWVLPGTKGASAQVELRPATTAIRLINMARTTTGSGARLSLRRHANGTVIEVRGTIGSRSGPRSYTYVVEDPAAFTTGAFKAALIEQGISVQGHARLGRTPTSAVQVASVKSPTLDRLIAVMNRESINHYAELIFRNATRGHDKSILGSARIGQGQLRQFFANKVGADTMALHAADGSGLSTYDRTTARAQLQMLAYAHKQPWGPSFHASLPVAGESELLRRRMTGSAARSNLHAKTGTTNEVIGLTGYVTSLNGEIIAFTFLYNGTDRWTARGAIDAMGQTLANFTR